MALCAVGWYSVCCVTAGDIANVNPAASGQPAAHSKPAASRDDVVFSARLHLTSRDLFDKAGTVFEALDAQGMPVIAAGFPDVFNTVQHHNDDNLHVFVRDGNDAVEITDIGKPAGWMTSSFLVAHGRLSAVNRSQGWERSLFDNGRQTWSLIDATSFSNLQAKALGVNLATHETDCGYTMTIRGASGFFGNCLLAGGRAVSLLGGVGGISIQANERLRPVFAANQTVILQYVGANSVEKGVVACHYGATLDLQRCVQRSHDRAEEFIYAIGADHGTIVVSTNFGNVFAIDPADLAITDVRATDGTSFQLYTSVQYRGDVVWGQYPGAEILKLDQGSFAPALPRLPIDHYRETAKAELQSFAIYKGDLFAGVWPFGEVYRLAPKASEWTLLHRFFPGGGIETNSIEPFSELTGGNLFGQRITDMKVFGDSLYIATGSKSGLRASSSLPRGMAAAMQDYGKMYRVRSSGALTVDLVSPRQSDAIDVVVRVTPTRLDVLDHHGKILASTPVVGTLACIARVELGQGTFGSLRGTAARVEVLVNTKSC
jgi:hypothetical protein